MGNSSNFSVTFGVSETQVNQPPTDPPEEEMFALAPLSEHHLPDGTVLARNRGNGRQMVLPLEVFNAMSYLDRFQTLDEHTALLMEGNPGAAGRDAEIRSIVKSVHDAGLTVSARDVCERLAPVEAAAPPGERPVVVVITWERPANLERLLDSLLANCDPEGIHCCFVVDDSRDPENQARNRSITRARGERSPLDMHYVGAEEAFGILGDLTAALPHYDRQVRFLIDRGRWASHWTAGIARNYSHLVSVGRPVIVLDDDVLCEVYESPLGEDGVEFSGRQREAQFFRDKAEWQPWLAGSGTDPIARHMQCLGLTVPEALGVLGIGKLKQRSFEHASPAYTERLQRNSRVLITQCGSVGDPGTGSNLWLPTMSPESINRMLQSPGLFQSALRDRNSWLGRTRPVFEPKANISQMTGFDNRVSLPPYFPIERGQDRLFANMVDFIFPDSVTLEYPWAAPHLPEPQRKWTENDNSFASQPHFPGFFTEYITQQKEGSPAANAGTRRERLALLFAELADSSRKRLVNLFADEWHRIRISQLGHFTESLGNTTGMPPDWVAYLNKAIAEIQSVQPGNFHEMTLRGSIEGLEGDALVDFWRNTWREFGHSIAAWPAIRECAREIIDERFD